MTEILNMKDIVKSYYLDAEELVVLDNVNLKIIGNFTGSQVHLAGPDFDNLAWLALLEAFDQLQVVYDSVFHSILLIP